VAAHAALPARLSGGEWGRLLTDTGRWFIGAVRTVDFAVAHSVHRDALGQGLAAELLRLATVGQRGAHRGKRGRRVGRPSPERGRRRRSVTRVRRNRRCRHRRRQQMQELRRQPPVGRTHHSLWNRTVTGLQFSIRNTFWPEITLRGKKIVSKEQENAPSNPLAISS